MSRNLDANGRGQIRNRHDQGRIGTDIQTGRLLPVVISVAVAAIATARVLWPELKIDGITLGLLAVAVLPWLAPLFTSVEGPGGWKVVFRELQQQTEQARGEAQSATKKAEFALSW